MEITCPSGLSGEVRKLKGSEANILSDRKAAKKGETFDKILIACWTKTEDPGPYEALGAAAGQPMIPWDKILVCDRFYALACIRIATYGSTFIFPTQCPSEACGIRFEWQIDLAKDLPVIDLPEASREAIRRGENRFAAKLGDHAIVFKLQTGSDEKRAGKRATQNRDQLMTVALSSRIIQVDDITRGQDIDQWLKDTDLDLQWDLLKDFEAVDGGIEQTIEIECQDCSRIYEVILPFEGEGFWIPSTRKSRSKRRTTRRGKVRTIGGEETEETDR